jgi:hypothetical protein
MNGVAFMNKALNQRSPEEWVERIERFPLPLRVNVANIVWWDFFRKRLNGERWHHLDDYLSIPTDATIPRMSVVNALIDLGYTEYQATGRIK